ncbi:Noc2p family-domain-containing protein [Massariosphaeria phaeospora]|uniref:Noc2p family-domain-containing protein n=1 Tax=Massariosphaeria phaeospora TaxID=100035 RepID=A0A7C8M527_9PLEO|nr:Noc2p family-domain-containing protein [Massariosphaeria phaeospora]
MPQAKSTKKFEKSRLKDVLKRRKDVAKIKQKQQIQTKLKERKAKDNAPADGVDPSAGTNGSGKEGTGDAFADMSMDQFFQGGFQVPEMAKKSASKTGKRKRTTVKAAVSAGSDEDMAEPPVAGEDIATDSESGEDGEAHKAQLAALADKDPEFYKYLKENDTELLDFEDADLAEIDALSASEDEETPRKKLKAQKREEVAEEGSNEVSEKQVGKWKASMKMDPPSLRAMKEVTLAFRSAAHLNDEASAAYKYSISDPDVYHEVLVTALHLIPKVLRHHLPIKETTAGKVRVPTDSKKFRTLTPLLKSHTVALNHLLENLSDPSTLRMTLESIKSLLPYLLSFKKVVKEVTKGVCSVWSDPSNTDETRFSAFLVLEKLIQIADSSIREAVLKQTYQGLVKGARNTTVHTNSGINIMKNTASTLWGIDPNVGYTTGFAFIRQLAVHLRTSITNNTKDAYKTVYNWQYVHSLDFWSRVVAVHCNSLREAETGKESPLRPLIYPIVQVTLGAMRLIPTAPYFPLRFQLVRSLIRVSSATSTYIPLASVLVEVLNTAEMKKQPKPSTLKTIDFATTIRATKAYLRTRTYQDGVGEQVVELLSEFFLLWTKNIAFPELALPVVVMLRRWLKAMTKRTGGNRNSKVNSVVALLVQKLEANSKWIEEKRAKVDFAPNSRAGVEGFLKEVEWEKTPLGAYVSGQRKTREQKAKLLEAARKTEDAKRKEADKAEAVEGLEEFPSSGSEEDIEEVDGFSEAEDDAAED